MDRKQVIETLEMENDLICFNPLTGEEIPLEYVNDLNRKCYDAHQEAIRLINNSIPIEWIMWYWRRSQPDGTQEDAWMKLGVLKMLRDWKKENEKQTVE